MVSPALTRFQKICATGGIFLASLLILVIQGILLLLWGSASHEWGAGCPLIPVAVDYIFIIGPTVVTLIYSFLMLMLRKRSKVLLFIGAIPFICMIWTVISMIYHSAQIHFHLFHLECGTAAEHICARLHMCYMMLFVTHVMLLFTYFATFPALRFLINRSDEAPNHLPRLTEMQLPLWKRILRVDRMVLAIFIVSVLGLISGVITSSLLGGFWHGYRQSQMPTIEHDFAIQITYMAPLILTAMSAILALFARLKRSLLWIVLSGVVGPTFVLLCCFVIFILITFNARTLSLVNCRLEPPIVKSNWNASCMGVKNIYVWMWVSVLLLGYFQLYVLFWVYTRWDTVRQELGVLNRAETDESTQFAAHEVGRGEGGVCEEEGEMNEVGLHPMPVAGMREDELL